MRARTVHQYTSDGTLVATYKTVRSAAKDAGLSVTLICNCLTGKSNMAGGFVYRYADKPRCQQTSRPSDDALSLYERVKSYALSLCHCTEMANDFVQEAYASYYEKFVDDGTSSAYAFLVSSVKWQFHNEVERHMQETEFDALEYCISNDDEDLEEVCKRKQDLHDAFTEKMEEVFSDIKTDKRRNHTRQIFYWYLQGYSQEEIAKRRNIKVQSAKQEIIKMRRYVCEKLSIPMREFTQYNCNIA